MQPIAIRKANKNHYGEVRHFYHSLIDDLSPEQCHVGWKKDIYPSPEYLQSSLEKGELYICRHEERIAAAMIVNHEYNQSYKNYHWKTCADDSELLVIHALGVHPDFQRKGYAKAMVWKAIALAEEIRMKAIRLDVLDGNIPAERLYQGMGFQYLSTIQMYYEDTGWTAFKLFELVM